MSTKAATQTIDTASSKVAAAIEDLRIAATAEGAVTKANVKDFTATVDDLIDALRAVKAEHKGILRVVQSTESKHRNSERVARALALLDAQEKEAAEAAE